MGNTPIELACQECGKDFEARRATARFCGGTCRQRFNRRLNGLQGFVAENIRVKVEISRVAAIVRKLREKFSLETLIIEDTGELADAWDALDEVVNPRCEICEKPANAHDDVLLCRRCEISQNDEYCWKCETRRPSVKSNDALCAKCAADEARATSQNATEPRHLPDTALSPVPTP